MLLPLFDKDCEHAGWLDPGKYIYDADMNFIAFIINSNAWSVETGNWLGPVQGLLCYDTNGKLMFWNPKEKITGIVTPRPSRQILSTNPNTAKPLNLQTEARQSVMLMYGLIYPFGAGFHSNSYNSLLFILCCGMKP